jgi:hypothetical protein
MKTVTVRQFMNFCPCCDYPEDRIRGIAGDKKEWSALDILALEDIPAKDRLWAVLRESLIDAPVLHEFACRCAETALNLAGNPDPQSVRAIAVKRRWLRSEATNKELDAARDAASFAARAAASDAARDAAWDTARDAARNAAHVAARDAVRNAAHVAAVDAAWDAARDAAWDEQVTMLTELLGEDRIKGQ